MAKPKGTLRESYDSTTYKSGTRKGITTGVFSSNVPHRAPALCYIAGIEVPIVSVSVNYGVWKIPEATITMFPDPQLQQFGKEDRVPVVIFYLDEYIDPANPTWRMLFEGEIVGWAYTNAAGGRALQFNCVMDIAMYTQLYLFYMSTVNALGQGAVQAKQDASALNVAVTEYPYALFHRGLIDNQDTSFIKRPFDLAYNVVRGLISSQVPEKRRCVPAVNFFTRWCRRNQFHNKWVALPFLDEQHDENLKAKPDQPEGVFPIFRAVKSQLAIEAVQKHVVTEYSGASVWTMLKRVLDTVFMEVAMIPTPTSVSTFTNGSIIGKPYVRSQKELNKLQAEASRKATEESKAQAAAFGTTPQSISMPVPSIIDPKKPIRLANYFVKPQFFFGLPPTCNVIFPSMTPQFQYQESYVTQPTRLYFEDNQLAALVGGPNQTAATSAIITAALSRAYPPEADQKHRDRLEKSSALTGKNLLIWPEEFFKGPVTTRVPAPPWLMYFSAQGQGKGATTTSTPDDKTVDPANGKSLTENDVYLLYAQYEYFRQRYVQRGGSVSCAFQPYVVPGFPLMVFDDFQSRMHIIGYLMNVGQQISSQGTGTSLNFSYARTIYEFLGDIKNEIDNPAIADRKGLATAAAPPEPIPEIRDIIQHEFKADQFYQALFNQRSDKDTSGKKSKTAVLRLRDLVAFVNSDGTLQDLFIEGKNEENIKASKTTAAWAKKFLTDLKTSPNAAIKYAKGTASAAELSNFIKAVNFAATGSTETSGDLTAYGGGYDVVAQNAVLKDQQFDALLFSLDTVIAGLNNPSTNHNLGLINAGAELTPRPGYEPMFDNYDSAMKYCARPICTLEDYIKFIGGEGVSPQDDVAYKDGGNIPSARYYIRIRQLKGATDSTTVTDDQKGLGKEGGAAVDVNFPVMRAQWDVTLLRYRRNVYNTVKVQR